jgi:superkiller protein 3
VTALLGALAGPAAPWAALSERGRERRWRLVELRAGSDGQREPVLSVVLLAQACREAGDVRGAEAVLRRALARHPDQVVLLHALGQLLRAQGQGRLGEAIECFRAARAVQPRLGVVLAQALREAERADEGEAVVRDLLRQQPNHPELYFHLGNALVGQNNLVGAAQAYRKAIDLRPDLPEAYNNLGTALYEQKELVGAVKAFRGAIHLRPDSASAYFNLGNALRAQKQLVEAVQAYRRAIALRPDDAKAYNNLGLALADQEQLGEAVKAYRKAIDLRPDDPEAYNNLGLALHARMQLGEAVKRYPGRTGRWAGALHARMQLGEAVKAFRKAIALRPDHAMAYNNLGNALLQQKQLGEAVKAFRKAIALQHDFAMAYNNLGTALAEQKELGAAVQAYRRAIHLRPDDAETYYNLGTVLGRQKEPVEAVKAYGKAIDLRPGFPEAHCNLGHALQDQGRFREALCSLWRGHELGSRRPGWPYPSAAWVAHCARLGELAGKLGAVLQGKGKPASPAEALELADLARHAARRLHATAARLAADAFAAQPRLAGDLGRQHRYHAACSAALAAAGRAEDAKGLSEADRGELRRQALAWLRADLAVYARLAERGNAKTRAAVRQRLAHWLQDADLAAVRDQACLSRLAWGERAEWHHLWEGIDVLRQRTARAQAP